MILMWGAGIDTTTADVDRELRHLGAEVVHLDQLDLVGPGGRSSAIDLTVSDSVAGTLHYGDAIVDLAEVSAAYVRPYDIHSFVRGDDVAHAAHAVELERLLWLWAEVTPAAVVNRPSSMAANSAKPFQSEQIRQAGFAVPRTLLTTDPEAVQRFWEACGEVIYKSISGVRSIVSRLQHVDHERLRHVVTCPVQFQEYVPGTDVRVHVVGDRVLAARIESDADDYRYARQRGDSARVSATTVPAEVARRCEDLARQQGLAVAGIDLRRTPQDAWYCFEVNPAPAFSFFDTDDHTIARAVANLLVEAASAQLPACTPAPIPSDVPEETRP